MRRLIYVLATIGYFLCLVWALQPTLCIGEPFRAWALMAGFALVAFASGESMAKFFPILALIIGLAGSVHAYQHNQREIEFIREMRREGEVRRRQLIQQSETNRVVEAQTNQVSQIEPEMSPFNCCP